MLKPQYMTPEHEAQKKAIYDSMSPRRRKFVDRIGFDKWNPFAEPKDPIEWRTDGTRRTTQQLVRDFLQVHAPEDHSTAYGSGVLEMCLGMVNGDERYIAMYEFSLWYAQELKKYNIDIKEYKP
ncbi:MAG: hypothetical protein EOL86_02735 [Deltaproteobacteria bacterium]|nr:hypothetical protein [Deltaproteobacteria bacterium]